MEQKTHRIFGVRESGEYYDREGAYLIPYRGDLVGVVQTPKGYFLLGGGLEKGEDHITCLKRECLEESGYSVLVGDRLCSAEAYTLHSVIGPFHPIQTYYSGQLLEKVSAPTETDHVLRWIEYDQLKGKMFSEMQNWALEQSRNT